MSGTQGAAAELVTALKARFSDSADVQLAMQRLKRAKQGANESVQSYEERIIDLAEEAFNTLDLSSPLIQVQLKDIFLDGIKDDVIARKTLN